MYVQGLQLAPCFSQSLKQKLVACETRNHVLHDCHARLHLLFSACGVERISLLDMNKPPPYYNSGTQNMYQAVSPSIH